MAKSQGESLSVDFNSSLKLKFKGSKVTSDGHTVNWMKRWDYPMQRLRFFKTSAQGETFDMTCSLLRQSAYSCLAGYEDVNDAERLSFDPARHVALERNPKRTRQARTPWNAKKRKC